MSSVLTRDSGLWHYTVNMVEFNSTSLMFFPREKKLQTPANCYNNNNRKVKDLKLWILEGLLYFLDTLELFWNACIKKSKELGANKPLYCIDFNCYKLLKKLPNRKRQKIWRQELITNVSFFFLFSLFVQPSRMND